MKINKLFIGFALALTLLIVTGTVYAASNLKQASNNGPLPDDLSNINDVKGFQSTPPITLTATLPSVQDSLMVYSLSPEISGAYNAAAVAEQFGLNGDQKEASNEIVFNDGNYHLEVNAKSGRIAYTDASRWMVGNDKDKNSSLPSNDQAASIAKEYLEGKNLMPKDAVIREVSHPCIEAIDKAGNVISVGFEDVKVSYAREINGLPVIGPGAKLDVEIGGNGDVIRVYKIWRNYAAYKEFQTVRPEAAFEKLKSEGITTGIRDVKSASVDNVSLAYYMKGATEEQSYLIPVYVFKGEAIGSGDNEKEQFVKYIPAVAGMKDLPARTK